MYTFDGENRLIILDAGVTEFTVADLYSRWKEWVQILDNSKWVNAFEETIGGNPLGSGLELNGYYFLTNGWQIRPQEADHDLSVIGDLYPVPDTAELFTDTVADFNVRIELQRSSATIIASGGGSGSIDETTINAIASAVWAQLLTDNANPNSFGEYLQKQLKIHIQNTALQGCNNG